MGKRKRIPVLRSDRFRVVLTETLPDEVPIMFSNEGLHKHLHRRTWPNDKISDLCKALLFGSDHQSIETNPLTYGVRKDEISLRTLSILHPQSQISFCEFYEKYHELLIYLCSKSPFSLRYPSKVASSFYSRGFLENLNKYRNSPVESQEQSGLAKHASSYFAYGGVNRLHKFFSSLDYQKLEKKFSHMWILDVSKCFDSIYTHCISWATKSRTFAKKHRLIKTTFDQRFDLIIRQANSGETNGIPIGPEVSRIFAEVIFQRLDTQAASELAQQELQNHEDYTVRRYVDDYYIFGISKKVCERVAQEISDQLASVNLHINSGKLHRLERPLLTDQSMVIAKTTREINSFISKFTKKVKHSDTYAVLPTKITSINSLKNDFINSIKVICSEGGGNYGMVSGYIIGSVDKRIITLLEGWELAPPETRPSASRYLRAMMLLLDVMFFLFTVDPNVNSSYKLSRSVILSSRFFSKNAPGESLTLSQFIYDLSMLYLSNAKSSEAFRRISYLPLENLNLVTAIGEIGDKNQIPADHLFRLFRIEQSGSSYFELMCLLHYSRDSSEYKVLNRQIGETIRRRCTSTPSDLSQTERFLMTLDSISCPFLSHDIRDELLIHLVEKVLGSSWTDSEITSCRQFFTENPWFIDWNETDVLNALEKKELKAAY